MITQHADKTIGKTMLKICLFIILAAFMMPAFAARLMSHEKFVHLNYEEQKKIVIATMELVVEMESKYKHEVKTSGFNPERYRRYTEFMKRVSALILSSAHAASVKNVRYGQYLNEFTTILNQRNRCIYGGWISEMRGDKCTHPLNTQFRNIYQTEGGCTGNSNQITCNPAIFGFKNVTSKTLFCVPAGINQADNTSRDCMAKALASPQESGASTREQRIANMIEGIGRNPNDANAVFDFLIKACACDSRTTQISEHYSNYMRPHQTCYSILKMMSEVTPQCQINNQPLMDTNQTQFLSTIKGILSEAEYKSSDVGAAYVRKIQDLRTNSEEFRSSETAVCGSSQGNSGGNSGGTTPRCVDRRTVPGGEFCCEEGKVPNAAKTDCVDSNGGGGAVVVDNTTGTTSGGVAGETSGGSTGTTGTTTGTTGTTTGTTGTTGTTSGGSTGETAGGSAGGTTSGCLPAETKELVGDQCLDKCTEPKPKRNADTKVCEACAETEEFAGGQCRVKCATPTPVRDEETHECKEDTGEDDDSSTEISITLSATNKDTNTTTVKVTLNPADTSKTPYTIIWFSRGTKRPSTFPGSTARPTPETPMTLTEDSTPEPTTTQTPEQTTEQADPATTTTTPTTTTPPDTTVRKPGENETDLNRDNFWGPLDAPRQNNDYEVCARLIKDNAKVSESCAKIPMKPIAAPRSSGGNPLQFPQMGPTRGGPSDAIFQGIR